MPSETRANRNPAPLQPPVTRRRPLVLSAAYSLLALAFVAILALAPFLSPPPEFSGDKPSVINYFASRASQSLTSDSTAKDTPPQSTAAIIEDGNGKSRVPLEIHIMSKCPDAKACMELLIAPALLEIKDKVDFGMSFIGKVDDVSGGVTCMHGPGECLGNMVHLCAQRLYPLNPSNSSSPSLYTNTTTFLPFSECLLHSYQRLPKEEFIKNCARNNGIDFDKINDCVSDLGDDGGMAMLRRSVEWSAQEHVTASCTVRVNGTTRCIRDGGAWKNCEGGSEVEDLVRDVEKAYDGGEEEEEWAEEEM